MELDTIKTLAKSMAELMKDNELSALEVCDGDFSLKLERKHDVAAPAPINVATHVQTTPSGPVAEVEKPPEEGVPIKSPMVGVFYAAPDPGTEPYVSLGHHVKKGDVLCIVEAMKLMNEITAEQDGVINKISCTNGQTVEFGQELFRMKVAEEA
ncbi:MAG: acetyl-CoA carboxylase biotin carboxyl carrier protein [Oscillospiraceae bacterium]|nr:acetyl-CoA carboxylase biotin carboxyl carrier protein [Oscillospiraceae bacterium]